MRTEGASNLGNRWLASATADRRPYGGTSVSYWRSDKEVADWEVIYRPPAPPHPVGTVLRKSIPGGWQIAVRRSADDNGWDVVCFSEFPLLHKVYTSQVICEHSPEWEVLHGAASN